MSSLPKRPLAAYLRQASFRQARHITERWVHESYVRGDFTISEPILYQAYVSDGGTALDRTRCRTISEFFETSFQKDPQLAATRESLLRLMSIVVKAHYFLFRMDTFYEEPLVFWIPDLTRSSKDRFGLYCPFTTSHKSLVVSQVDLGLLNGGKPGLGRFPAVLLPDHQQWLDFRYWETLAKEGEQLRLIQDQITASDSSEFRSARDYADASSFPFGRLFDVPLDLRPQMKMAGLRFADALGLMYLPHGFDLNAIQAYYDYLMAEWQMAQALRLSLSGEHPF